MLVFVEKNNIMAVRTVPVTTTGPNTHLAAQAHLSYCLSNTMSPVQPVISARHFSQWCHALVTPRLKKPALDPDTASSYRPISSLSFISKLVELLVTKRFMSHVNLHTLLPAVVGN